MTQTKVPRGYNLLAAPVNLSINSSTPLTLAYDETTGNKYYKYNVTVYNTMVPTVETGETGYIGYVLCGILLLIISTACFVFMAPKRKRYYR